jgi:DNA-binding LacI/PurR family transcriptional regulator
LLYIFCKTFYLPAGRLPDMGRAPESKVVTIRDVARRARVSPSTVSNSLTGKRQVSEVTCRRVKRAVEQLGYSPNMLARSLVSRHSQSLGVVASGLEYVGPSQTLTSIEQQANALGYSLFLHLLHLADARHANATLAALMAHRVEGIIWAVPEIGNNRSWIASRPLNRLPSTVFLSMGARPGFFTVAIDNRAGAALGVRHLLDQGCQTIGLITGPLDWWEAQERRTGWEETLRLAGLDTSESLVAEGDWSAESGERGLGQLIDQRPDLDAVFISNDQMALGALRVAYQQRLRVPQDLAIVGYDDIPESAYFRPALTTVFQPLIDLGRVAVQMVHKLIEARVDGAAHREANATVLKPSLVVRESALPDDADRQ